jgi:predicted nucleotidyltransferase
MVDGEVEIEDERLSQDSDQIAKWEYFLEMKSLQHTENGKSLLSIMELVGEDDEDIILFKEEKTSELSKEMVDQIATTRMNKRVGLKLEPCVKRKKKGD